MTGSNASGAFSRALAAAQADAPRPRRWLFVPYDQLTATLGPLSRHRPDELGVLLIESTWKGRRRPYHKQKLALVLANMRHFALEQAERGFAVRYVQTDEPYEHVLESLVDLGPFAVMAPAERELRVALAPLEKSGIVAVEPHEGWLSTAADFESSQGADTPWRMDRFYRHMRRKTGLLMQDGKPLGGKFSHDAANRQPWKGSPSLPEPPTFEPDDITLEVCELVERAFAEHPGELCPTALPATADDANALWRWAVDSCMATFGPFEDAMTTRSTGLFHTRISALLNLHRLTPKSVVDDVASLDIPLASKEGFIRQVLGWREFVRHVHRETDGFRKSTDGTALAVADRPGDGGYSTWRGRPFANSEGGPDGGAKPSELGAARSMPVAFWGAASGLHCLDRVVEDVWREAYSHHITRLMILCNLAALLDVEPRAVADWFWISYSDAYDWVVEPNVLGMGLFATGDLFTTKPYVSGTPYIHKMSDYCDGCRFHPKKNCPITSLYWAYLGRHESALSDVSRMRLPLATLSKRSAAKRRHDRDVFETVSTHLANGKALSPPDLPAP